jgi:hypothetical protein
MRDDEVFSTFPPGLRWFVGLRIEEGRVGIMVREGTDKSDPLDLDMRGSSAIYVFGDKITEEELKPVVRRMFMQTGPPITEVYAGRIENMLTPMYVWVPEDEDE